MRGDMQTWGQPAGQPARGGQTVMDSWMEKERESETAQEGQSPEEWEGERGPGARVGGQAGPTGAAGTGTQGPQGAPGRLPQDSCAPVRAGETPSARSGGSEGVTGPQGHSARQSRKAESPCQLVSPLTEKDAWRMEVMGSWRDPHTSGHARVQTCWLTGCVQDVARRAEIQN